MTVVNDWMGDVWRITDDGEIGQSIPMPSDDDAVGSLETTTVYALRHTLQGIGLTFDGDTHLMVIRNTSGVDIPVTVGIAHYLDVPLGISSLRLRIRWDGAEVVMEYSADDGIEWFPVDTISQIDPPTDCLLYYSHAPGQGSEQAVYYQTRSLNGVLDPNDASVSQTIDPPVNAAVLVGDPTATDEHIVHGLIAAQFGDLEFDTGTSVRWTQWFTDDIFISDVNDGNQRFWVINWDKTFPSAVNSLITGLNFFADPVAFRKRQFSDFITFATKYPSKLTVNDDDWVLFVDTHEGMSADTTSLPDNYGIDPFKSFIAREIERAGTNEYVSVPFFVYLYHDHTQNVSYEYNGLYVEQAAGVPYYVPQDGVVRLIKVSALKDVLFDWTLLDQPTTADAGVKIQVVSYGYAHWQSLDVPPGETEVPPLDADNDLGWRQRCLLMTVRPVTGLLTGAPNDPVGTWQDPAGDDDIGLPGPWVVDTYADRGITIEVPTAVPSPDAATAGVLVPLYDSVLRLNLRDGLWYDNADGNTPVLYNEATSQWEPVTA